MTGLGGGARVGEVTEAVEAISKKRRMRRGVRHAA
jgi:hypothetical protein